MPTKTIPKNLLNLIQDTDLSDISLLSQTQLIIKKKKRRELVSLKFQPGTKQINLIKSLTSSTKELALD